MGAPRSVRIAGRALRFSAASGGREEEFIAALNHQMEFPVAARLFSDLRGLDDKPIAAEIFARAVEELRAGEPSPEDKLLLIRLIGRSSWETAGDVLTALWAKPSDDTTRTALATSLLALDSDKAAPLLLAPGAWSRYSPHPSGRVAQSATRPRTKLEPILGRVGVGRIASRHAQCKPTGSARKACRCENPGTGLETLRGHRL
jgi:hypothetical protein